MGSRRGGDISPMPHAHALDRSRLHRVLVVAGDRRFRTVTTTLLAQRGYSVAAGGHDEDIVELAVRERADVVVLDTSTSLTVTACQAARLDALQPRVGVVAVGNEPGASLSALPVLDKWGAIDELYAAIDRAGHREGVSAPL